MESIEEIIKTLKPIKYIGTENILISKPIQLSAHNVDENAIMWVNDKNLDKLQMIETGTIICSEQNTTFKPTCNYIVVKNPRLAFRILLEAFFVPIQIPVIASTAIIDKTAKIGSSANIGNNVIIEKNCIIGDNCTIGHNTVILQNTILKDNVSIGSNCTIGGSGFGYEKNENNEFEFIPHVGNVVIEELVEIGNNTCIDKAVLGSTWIRKNVKIDNLVHIAHGVTIGQNSLIIANAMIGGSSSIGENVWFAPSASILNKKNVADNATIGMGAVVLKDVDRNDVIIGNPGKSLKK